MHGRRNAILLSFQVDQHANLSETGSVAGTTATTKQVATSGGFTPPAHIDERDLIISTISNQFADAMKEPLRINDRQLFTNMGVDLGCERGHRIHGKCVGTL
jgi:hypothetical protein